MQGGRGSNSTNDTHRGREESESSRSGGSGGGGGGGSSRGGRGCSGGGNRRRGQYSRWVSAGGIGATLDVQMVYYTKRKRVYLFKIPRMVSCSCFLTLHLYGDRMTIFWVSDVFNVLHVFSMCHVV